MGEIRFFGEIDHNAKGQISSSYPAWYFTPHIEELSEEVDDLERALKSKTVPYDQIPMIEDQLKGSQARLEAIRESRPKISAKEEEDLAKVYEELSKHIANSMFTYSEEMFGTASAHEVVRRQKKFCVPLAKNLAKSLLLNYEDGLTTIKDAVKAWKIIGKLLGEPTNEEVLRRDRVTARSNFIGLHEAHESVKENL